MFNPQTYRAHHTEKWNPIKATDECSSRSAETNHIFQGFSTFFSLSTLHSNEVVTSFALNRDLRHPSRRIVAGDAGENTTPGPLAVEGFCSKIPSKCHPFKVHMEKGPLGFVHCSVTSHPVPARPPTKSPSFSHVKKKERILWILKQKYDIYIYILYTNLPWKSIYKCRYTWATVPPMDPS